jgi:hypothetical protein
MITTALAAAPPAPLLPAAGAGPEGRPSSIDEPGWEAV